MNKLINDKFDKFNKMNIISNTKRGIFMKYYKKIDGKNIYLASISLDDAENYLQMKNATSAIAKIVFDQYQAEEEYDLEKAKAELNDLAVKNAFAVVSKNNNKMIGLIGLSNTLALNLRSDMWVKMYTNIDYERQVFLGAEAVNLLLEYCYDVMNLHSIVMRTPSFNIQAIDIMNHSYMEYYGSRTSSEKYSDDKYYDTLYYQCTPSIYSRKKEVSVTSNNTPIYITDGKILDIANNDMSNMSSIIKGDRITLEKYAGQKEYIEQLATYLNDSRVSIPLGEYKTNWNDYRAEKQLQNVDYVITKDDRLLGYINLFRKDLRNKTADLEILIGDVEQQHQGYGREALDLFLQEQYQNGAFNNLLSCIFEFNEASVNLHKSLGYHIIGTRCEGYFANGKLNDMHLYEMTEEIQKKKIR